MITIELKDSYSNLKNTKHYFDDCNENIVTSTPIGNCRHYLIIRISPDFHNDSTF